jgi:hypothetical protein
MGATGCCPLQARANPANAPGARGAPLRLVTLDERVKPPAKTPRRALSTYRGLYNRPLVCDSCFMNTPARPDHYKHHRFPIEIISHGVWLYYRFCLSYRDGVVNLLSASCLPA